MSRVRRLVRRIDLLLAPTEWTRHRLQILLALSVVMGLALAIGAVLSVMSLLRDEPASTSPTSAAPKEGAEPDRRDELANEPLPEAALEDAQPGALSSAEAPRIVLPSSTGYGPVEVPSGFPHTPEGAMAQLIAIDRAALESTSVPRAQEVISAWAEPGGPTAESWTGVTSVATLLSSGGFPAAGAPQLSMVAEPAMGFIKGTVGRDFVVPCIDFVLTATTAESTNRIAAADCQRMVWRSGRWRVGPGEEPAPPPALWPGGQKSIDVGYQWLAPAPSHEAQ